MVKFLPSYTPGGLFIYANIIFYTPGGIVM